LCTNTCPTSGGTTYEATTTAVGFSVSFYSSPVTNRSGWRLAFRADFARSWGSSTQSSDTQFANVRSKQRVTFRFASARRRSSASKTVFIFDLPRGDEDRWGSRGRKPKGILNPHFRDKDHHSGQGRSMHHAVDSQAYHRSITITVTHMEASRSIRLFKLDSRPPRHC
jgi:hypothetical protein